MSYLEGKLEALATKEDLARLEASLKAEMLTKSDMFKIVGLQFGGIAAIGGIAAGIVALVRL